MDATPGIFGKQPRHVERNCHGQIGVYNLCALISIPSIQEKAVDMQPHELIFDSHLVLETFGLWPSFHDGEVHRLVLDRTRRSPNGAYVPAIELVVRGWNLIPDKENNGLYKEKNDSVVHFLFEEVTDVEFDGFNHQNVLDCLEFALVQTERKHN